MGLANLAYPQWHLVNCDEKVHADVICSKKQEFDHTKTDLIFPRNHLNETDSLHCRRHQILLGQHCLHFTKSLTESKFSKGLILMKIVEIPNHLIEYLSRVSEAVLYFHFLSLQKYTGNLYHYDSFLSKIKVSDHFHKAEENTNIINILHFNKTKNIRKKELQQFTCHSGEFISTYHLYNGRPDCISSNDEAHPQCYHQKQPPTHLSCLGQHLPSQRQKCSDLFFKSVEGSCLPFSKVCRGQNCKVEVNTDPLRIKLSQQDNRFIQNDAKVEVYTDCLKEEILLSQSIIQKRVSDCVAPDQLPCTLGCEQCFAIGKLCVFEVDRNRKLMHCPSGAHLKNCKKMECSKMLKCTQSYCIPYR